MAMTPEEQARERLIAVIMRGLKAYAPDETETYGHDEAEMIADYVGPYIAAALRTAREEEREAVERAVQSLRGLRIEGFHVLTGTDTDAILAAIRARAHG